ncbi:hypothetical protein [Shinella sp. HZN7]|uniref:hypothetical protein n=1 Tax=Shinella sp. (strain HZN7) TaxID=879274 RepID=UPI0007DA8893|nr:hypothetical protein [Shinella sp. HZN7]ANH04609.1 hypothetical protein shn_11550 [Shinella sp. HZN7]
MAASNDLDYTERQGLAYEFPALADTLYYGRAGIGVTAAGVAVPAGHVNAVKLVGFAAERVDNRGGAAGAQRVRVKKGVFRIPLAGATAANIQAPVYMTADDTFTLTASTNLQIGTIDAVDADGVWLKTL